MRSLVLAIAAVVIVAPAYAWTQTFSTDFDGTGTGGSFTLSEPSIPDHSGYSSSSSGGGGGGGSHSSGPSWSELYAQARNEARQQAERLNDDADSALSGRDYEGAIKLYDKALNVYYTKANEHYYDHKKRDARQAWVDAKWAQVVAAVNERRYKDLPSLLDDVQRVWYTKDLQRQIDQLKKTIADHDAQVRAAQKANEQAQQRLAANAAKKNTALEEAQQAKTTQDAALAGRTKTNEVYDTHSTAPPAALTPVAVPNGSPAVNVAAALEIKLDLNDPKNQDVKAALNQVEYMLKYNAKAAASSGPNTIPPAPEAFQSSVNKLNEVLQSHGQPTMKPEEVQKKYTSFSLTLTEQPAGQPPKGGAGSAGTGAGTGAATGAGTGTGAGAAAGGKDPGVH